MDLDLRKSGRQKFPTGKKDSKKDFEGIITVGSKMKGIVGGKTRPRKEKGEHI